MGQYTVAADGAATAVASTAAVGALNLMTSGVLKAITADKTVAYGGSALQKVVLGGALMGFVGGNFWATRKITKAIEAGETAPKPLLGFLTL